MLGATAAGAQPHDWKVDGEATEGDGVTEAWLTFKTNVAQCEGPNPAKERQVLDPVDRND